MTNTFRAFNERSLRLWPLRHLTRVMRKHDLTNKKNNEKDKDKNDDKYIENTPKGGFLKTLFENTHK